VDPDLRLEPLRAPRGALLPRRRLRADRLLRERRLSDVVQGLVAAGVGVALIPKLALAGAREDIAIRALSPSSPVREVVAATPEGSRLTPAAAAMGAILETVAARFAGLGPLS
jgi:DNA-binding transcriptional LysR family regulator